MTAPADIRVQRHVADCRVLGSGPEGRRALLAALEHDLALDLEDALGAIGLTGYWVLRRLDVRACVGAAWSSPRMSGAVAREVACAVADRVRQGGDPETALWFPDRAAFVARFLLDLAEGRARERWEYAQFAELLRDPYAGPATLAADEPDVVADALLLLAPTELEIVASSCDGDALLQVLGGPSRPVSVEPLLLALRQLASAGRLEVPGVALVVAVTAARASGLPVATVSGAARELAGILDLLRAGGSRRPELVAAVRDGRWRDLVALVGPTDAFLPLVRWSPADRAALMTALEGPPLTRAEVDRVHTPFGGGLLLLPLLDDLGDWPATSAGVAKLACLTSALGRGRSLAPAADPVLRAALGVPDDLDVATWVEGLTDEDVRDLESRIRLAETSEAFLRLPATLGATAGGSLVSRVARAAYAELGRRLPGMASASPAYLWRNVLDLDASVVFGVAEVVVELGHAPLSVLLSLTGLDRGSFVEVEGSRRWTLTTRS